MTIGGSPADSILHWDADIDAFSEQTGGVHSFQHSVLSPQYQLNADGSYTDVGAKPAVDTFDGEKWLRSCGAVTNLLPSGAEDLTASSWIKRGDAVVAAGNLVSGIGPGDVFIYSTGLTAGTSLTPSIEIKRVSTTGVLLIGNPAGGQLGAWSVDLSLLSDDYEKITSDHPSVSAVNAFVVSSNGVSGFHFWRISGVSPLSFYARNPQLTATSYPVPYVPPGVTQPASNATTTNGSWFALPDGSPMWKALTGQPLTLATRVRMGVGSGDKPDDVILGAGGPVPMYTKTSGDEKTMLLSYDGTAARSVLVLFPRNTIITRVTQVSADGTQYRVGHMIAGTHTAIQWSPWGAFDGSFNPSTLYRLMLGYNTRYPIWYNKITVWKKQATDAEILEAMA